MLLVAVFSLLVMSTPVYAEQAPPPEPAAAEPVTGFSSADCPTQLSLVPVTWLDTTPRIDGRLDPELEHLPIRTFPVIENLSREPEVPGARWRIGYGIDFLYLYLETDADEFTFRDRAYQNGDGFHLLIADPRADEAPTDEFYLLACSAVNDRRLEWSRRIFWYYNVDTIFRRTSEATRLESAAQGGTIGFELLLPWSDVPPYHPWLSDGIGFNLCFVKALPDGGRSRYSVLDDPDLRAEYRPRRYARLTFSEPAPGSEARTFVRPDVRHVVRGRPAQVSAATLSAGPFVESIDIFIESPDRTGPSVWTRMEYTLSAGVGRYTWTTPDLNLPPGNYVLRYESAQSGISGQTDLTVRRAFDPVALLSRLAEVDGTLAESSRTTLALHIYETAEGLDGLKSYETGGALLTAVEDILLTIEAAEAGRDLIAERTGYVRRAYHSTLDGSLQPYLVKIPRRLEEERTYPLIVYLHGSASTEQDLRGFDFLVPDEAFGLAPFGRGPSTGWCTGNAQTDIAEAIAAVRAAFPIDPDRIVLTGFSMGGYGVLRTWLDSPAAFRGLAVLSGEPYPLRSLQPADGCPDLRTADHAARFAGVPLFIYHGEADQNCPYDDMQAFTAELEAAGARVTFVTGAGQGHGQPDRAAQRRYLTWLREILER